MQDSRRLYRSRTDRRVSGVAGGLAHYFDVDPTLVRILWLVVAFSTGVGFVAYIAAAILIPEGPEVSKSSGGGASHGESANAEHRPEESAPAESTDTPRASSGLAGGGDRRLFGGALVVVGGVLLVQNFWRWADMGRILWPALLILVGVGMFSRGLGGDK